MKPTDGSPIKKVTLTSLQPPVTSTTNVVKEQGPDPKHSLNGGASSTGVTDKVLVNDEAKLPAEATKKPQESKFNRLKTASDLTGIQFENK